MSPIDSGMIRRFQAVAPRGAHGNDKPDREVKVFRLRRGPRRDVRFARVGLRELASRSARRLGEKEASSASQPQGLKSLLGKYNDDPLWDEYSEILAQYRNQIDAISE